MAVGSSNARGQSGPISDRDPLAEHVPGLREREGDVRVQALEPLGPGRATDPELERRPRPFRPRPGRGCAGARAGGSWPARGSFAARDPPGRLGPALDPAGCLQAGHRCSEVAAGEVVRGREGLPRHVVGRLLRHGREPEGTADGHAPERARSAADLTFDGGPVVLAHRAQASARPGVRLEPLLDPAHDEQVLAGPDVAEAARLLEQRLAGPGEGQALLQHGLLARKRLHFRLALRELVRRRDVRLDRPVVEEADQAGARDHDDPESWIPPRTGRREGRTRMDTPALVP